MTFLNWTILIGLLAVAIPVIIHLFNRRRATGVDWGAMRFLTASLASRQKRIFLEDALLMMLRCALVMCIVLAAARPFVPSRSGLSWALVLPAAMVAAMLIAVGGVLRGRRSWRWACWLTAAGLVAAAGAVCGYEHVYQQKLWQDGGGAKDVAIVIDASGSMTISSGPATSFQRAIDEARGVVEACRRGDAVSVILAGPVPRAVAPAASEHDPAPGPTFELKEILQALPKLSPAGGKQNVLGALQSAAASLAKGHNPRKKIVLITDNQAINWRSADDAPWAALAGTLDNLPDRPQVVVRTLGMPGSIRNLAVADVRLSRGVVGTDRPVAIEVNVANTGTTALRGQYVELLADGKRLALAELGPLPPGASETAKFSHQFTQPRPHVLRAQLAGKVDGATRNLAWEDDMPADNQAAIVVNVVRQMPVLVVDGAPASDWRQSSGGLLTKALCPGANPTPSPAATPGEDLIVPTVIAAPDTFNVKDFSAYRMVVLANVPRLSAPTATALAQYVRDGGGLLIAPGNKAEPAFYNLWSSATGQKVCPATMSDARVLPDDPVHLSTKTFTHPALRRTGDQGQSNASSALVRAYWPLTPDASDPAIRIAGLMANGAPFMMERKLGNGYVLQAALSLDSYDSNLPSLSCFVTLLQDIAQYLAAPQVPQLNIAPAPEVAISWPLEPQQAQTLAGRIKPGATLNVQTPSQHRREAVVSGIGQTLDVRFRGAHEPGIYRVLTGPNDPAAAENTALPFAVIADPSESTLTHLSQADLGLVRKHVDMFHAQSQAELTAAIAGGVPGQEAWRTLAVAALLALLAEIALTRWIAVQRKGRQSQAVKFGPDATGAARRGRRQIAEHADRS